MKKSTATKKKYNLANYRRYEFNIRGDSKLNSLIERHKANGENLSELIKICLCQHFGISREEADQLYVPYHLDENGERIVNHDLDKYFEQNTTGST